MLKRYTDRLAPYAPLILRLIIGIIFLAHGFMKIQNPAGTAGFFGSLGLPLPTLTAWFIILLEVVGGLALILGLGTRWLGILFAIEMVVATLVFKLPNGIGLIEGQATGYELELALIAGSLALTLLGSGPLSIERDVLKREL